MNFLQNLVGGLTKKAVDSATTAASDAAAAQYETYKPIIYAAAFMAVTAWLFFLLPRFRLPWDKAS